MTTQGNNAANLLAFFRSKKTLTDPEIAGIMGNLQLESGFDPNAGNPAEGAIGIAQWEGGRRTNLERYASANKMHANDLAAQEGYLWQELTGPYSGVYRNLRSTQDAATAARYWDVGPGGTNSGTGFENSAGTTQQGRRDNAISILSQIKAGSLKGGVANPPSSGGTTAQLAATSDSSALGNPLSGLNIVAATQHVADALSTVGKFFKALTWIFNVNHFFKAALYIFGTGAVLAGIFLIVYGAGKDRPAD